ncbi:MAG: LysM peptidoglycan-binding domain-containing protein [Betaproteobacteria bacterium]
MANEPLILRPGDVIPPVGNLQEQLNSVIYAGLTVDNIFGPATEGAVREFQRRSGLPVTGVVDESTWRRLFLGQPLPAEVVGKDPPQEFPAIGGYSIEVNLAARTLTLFRNGVWQASFPVAIGKPATPSPVGNFTILNKAWEPGGVFGTRWLGVTENGIGIHGTDAPASIGLAVSNGCIRMYNQDIESFFGAVNVGDPVRIVAGAAMPGNTYTVQPGDTLYLIAQRFGLSVEELRRANNLTSDIIYPGQVLFIPGAAPPSPPPPPPGPAPTPGPGTMLYTVKPGDTLFLIAQQFNTTLEELRRLNNIQGDLIYPGQTLLVPTTGLPETYTVQRGDTLYFIAQRFGTTVAELRRLNNLTSDVIFPGQVLRLR